MTEKVHNEKQIHAFIHQTKKTKNNNVAFNLRGDALPYLGMIKE